MTPNEVCELDDDMFGAFTAYMREELRARERAAKRKR